MNDAHNGRTRTRPQTTVLVVDDDEGVGAFVRAALPSAKFRTLWAPDIEAARTSAAAHPPDLAIVDISLDGSGSGLDFLRLFRADPASASVPVVMLTGSSDTLNRERSLRLGADRYLMKPVAAETLRRVVNEILSSHDEVLSTMSLRGDQVSRLRELFFDAATEIPTLAIVVEDLRRIIESGEQLQVFCIELEPLFRLGERDYWDAYDALREEFVRSLHVMVAPLLGNEVILATSHSGASDFYCFVRESGRATVAASVRELERVARLALRTIKADPILADEVTIFAGGSTTQAQLMSPPRMLYNSVREAKDAAERRETRFRHTLREKLSRAIREQTITTLFQPVIDLATRRVRGYEALSRGPAGSDIENPEVIFELAREFEMVWEVEKLCIENVRPHLTDVCRRGLLFFNLESQFIQQLQQRGTDVFEPFFECHEQVVIEVTERSAIRDYRTFRRTLHELKAIGFKIAIDDCGSGYATLEAVAELRPDYLKVGHSLFNGVETDPIRRRIVDLVARCADTIHATTIAEAIETESQMRVCAELGIQHGQGWFFAAAAPWEAVRDLRFEA